MPLPSSATTPTLGQVGVWRGGGILTPEMASSIEKLGYSALWLGGSPAADLQIAEDLLDATEHLTVATGIVNIWTAPAPQVAESFHRLERTHPGRFLLGIGIGHREAQGETYQKPYAALVAYLDALDAAGVPADRRVISALGPKTLKLSAERAAGTHPYLTTPTHTRCARAAVGDGPLVAPEQRLILDTDADAARAAGRRFLARYLGLTNYRRTLERHGFTSDDLEDGATDEAVDALTPHGSAAQLAAVIRGQLDAGADHVCAQVLPARADPLETLGPLASELGLR
ncbi:MAG: TIGR03620 family F420-dependent LLM class oxidoreductase [Candidatus Microbacterium stercoravium]